MPLLHYWQARIEMSAIPHLLVHLRSSVCQRAQFRQRGLILLRRRRALRCLPRSLLLPLLQYRSFLLDVW